MGVISCLSIEFDEWSYPEFSTVQRRLCTWYFHAPNEDLICEWRVQYPSMSNWISVNHVFLGRQISFVLWSRLGTMQRLPDSTYLSRINSGPNSYFRFSSSPCSWSFIRLLCSTHLVPTVKKKSAFILQFVPLLVLVFSIKLLPRQLSCRDPSALYHLLGLFYSCYVL